MLKDEGQKSTASIGLLKEASEKFILPQVNNEYRKYVNLTLFSVGNN